MDRLPPAMAGLRLLDVDAAWVTTPGRLAGVGVVHDTAAGLLTAVLRVTGDGQFSLTSAETQDARVALWGDALGGFCRERADGVPHRVAGVVDLDRWSKPTVRADDDARRARWLMAAADYAELVTHAAPRAVTHDTLVSSDGRSRRDADAPGPTGRRAWPAGLQTARRGAAAVHACGSRRPGCASTRR